MRDNSNDNEFREFVDREFDKTSDYANIDELIEFAFGELESAIEAFERVRGKKYDNPEQYLEDEYFLGFVSDEFDDVQVYATDEEMAAWALGSIEEAQDEFEEQGDGN